MRANRLKALHAANAPIVNAWLSIASAYAAEVVAAQGFDCVTVDLQHGMIGFDAAVPMLQAIATTPAVPLVRCTTAHAPEIMKLLDAGAYGVICPQIDTPEQAATLVAACRYPPRGSRSFGPARGLLYGGADYFDGADDEILALAMIESRPALDALDAILDTPGLDGIYVGPNDLALSLGMRPGAPTAELDAAIAAILAAARQRGLIAGIFCADSDAARSRLEQGFGLVTPGNDVGTLGAACRQRIAAARAARA